ncbi:MAG: hypothetical protein MK212_06345 [Saprospiraceae bacterium]|nr:hypothetical protein [Saprospiraceae bacterium]
MINKQINLQIEALVLSGDAINIELARCLASSQAIDFNQLLKPSIELLQMLGICKGQMAMHLAEYYTQLRTTTELSIHIVNLPKLVGYASYLQHLSSLKIRGMQECIFPNALFAFPNLKKIELEAIKICAIPSTIRLLKNLEVLSLKIEKDIRQLAYLSSLTKLHTLKIQCDAWTILPLSILQLKQLKSLELKCSNLTYIHPKTLNLENLEHLLLHSKRLLDLPDILFKLPNLHRLDLYINRSKMLLKLSKLAQIKVLQLRFARSLFYVSKLEHILSRLTQLNCLKIMPQQKPQLFTPKEANRWLAYKEKLVYQLDNLKELNIQTYMLDTEYTDWRIVFRKNINSSIGICLLSLILGGLIWLFFV